MSHLHYEGDTMIVRVPLVDNLLSIKVILRSFELALRLKVNFVKSSIFGQCGEKVSGFGRGFYTKQSRFPFFQVLGPPS